MTRFESWILSYGDKALRSFINVANYYINNITLNGHE